MTICFTGEWKDLKGMGYSFHKLYAANYICYQKDDVLIWKKGSEVGIDDFHGNSDKVLQYLIDRDFTVPNTFNIVVLNRKTKQMEEYDKTKHEDIFVFENLSEEERKEFYKTYKKTLLSEEVIACVKELYEKGWIEIREKESE